MAEGLVGDIRSARVERSGVIVRNLDTSTEMLRPDVTNLPDVQSYLAEISAQIRQVSTLNPQSRRAINILLSATMPLPGPGGNVPGALVLFKPGFKTAPLRQHAKKTRRTGSGQGFEHFTRDPFGRYGRKLLPADGPHLGKSLAGYAPVGPARRKPRQPENAGRVVGKGAG